MLRATRQLFEAAPLAVVRATSFHGSFTPSADAVVCAGQQRVR